MQGAWSDFWFNAASDWAVTAVIDVGVICFLRYTGAVSQAALGTGRAVCRAASLSTVRKGGPTEMAQKPTSHGGVQQGPAAARQQKIGAPRYAADLVTTAVDLGPLGNLAGTWKGSGFSQMWRPDNTDPASDNPSGTRRFLQLNQTVETLTFTTIPTPIPNRGVGDQPDITIYGLHYLQSINDGDPKEFPNHGEALHIEPGLFLNVPASGKKSDGTVVTDGNVLPPTIVRLGSIPPASQYSCRVLPQALRRWPAHQLFPTSTQSPSSPHSYPPSPHGCRPRHPACEPGAIHGG